ncbi:MAG: hypothetical protein [Sclerotinia sclerotiorum narnavirus 1]|nr:MAG: hypothetical protein [Sclerotinia sclerotiorum narnavirus 1]
MFSTRSSRALIIRILRIIGSTLGLLSILNSPRIHALLVFYQSHHGTPRGQTCLTPRSWRDSIPDGEKSFSHAAPPSQGAMYHGQSTYHTVISLLTVLRSVFLTEPRPSDQVVSKATLV